jgi:hypothetical protein
VWEHFIRGDETPYNLRRPRYEKQTGIVADYDTPIYQPFERSAADFPKPKIPSLTEDLAEEIEKQTGKRLGLCIRSLAPKPSPTLAEIKSWAELPVSIEDEDITFQGKPLSVIFRGFPA